MAKVKCAFFESPTTNSYRCHLQPQIITSEIVHFDAAHKEGRKNSDVDHLSIPSVNLMKFPMNIHKPFPNLTFLQMNHCKLVDGLKREYFTNLTGLVTFWITECGLTRLKGDLFSDLRMLEWVSFENNRIQEIDPETFDGLALKCLALEGNVKINLTYDSRDSSKVTLEDVIREVRLKCRPKNVAQPRNDDRDNERMRENEKLKDQNRDLKISMQKQDDLIKSLKDHIATIIKQKTEQKDTMAVNLKKIFADDDFKDFTINVGEASFRIHKLLFAARSEVLREMLKNNPEAVELNLRDIPESTFKSVHDFIYKDQLSASADHIEVFAAANRLKIDDLTKAAATRLLANVDENNCIDVLVLGNKFEHEELRQKSFNVIRTKIFPDRKLNDELAKQPEKLRKLIDTKRMLDRELEAMMRDVGESGGRVDTISF
jgi:hypothetical protein